MNAWRHLHEDECGQGVIEYALAIALIAVVLIVVISTFGGKMNTFFSGAEEHLIAPDESK